MRSYDKNNLVNVNSPIFDISKTHKLKTLTGVERSSPNSFTLVNLSRHPDLIGARKNEGA
jgi:hypothetical protein